MTNKEIARVFHKIYLSTLLLVTGVFILANIAVAQGDETQKVTIEGNDTNPVRFVVVGGNDGAIHYNNEDGGNVVLQIFYFDPNSKQSSPPEGPSQTKYTEGVPIPVAVYIQSLLSGRPAISGVFANSIGKLSGLDDLTMAVLLSQDAEKISTIDITPNKEEEFFISPDYLVYPGNLRSVDKSGPYAKVQFRVGSMNEPLSIVLKRNKKTVESDTLKPGKDISLKFENVMKSDDIVEWTVTDKEGKTIEKGALGFPVRSAVPELVVYTVNLLE